jgi:hypothetical protein
VHDYGLIRFIQDPDVLTDAEQSQPAEAAAAAQ